MAGAFRRLRTTRRAGDCHAGRPPAHGVQADSREQRVAEEAGRIVPIRIEDELQDQLPRLRDERHRQPRPARRARRPQARPSPDPLHDARDGADLGVQLPQVRRNRRRGDGQVPPARRRRAVRRACAPRPDVLAALPAHRRPGQLRLCRRRPAGRDEVHRGAHDRHRGRSARGHRQADRRFRRELRRHADAAVGAAGEAAQPACQRLVRHRRGHGDEHSAAPPRRDRRGDDRADRRSRADQRRACATTSTGPTSRPAQRSSDETRGATR